MKDNSGNKSVKQKRILNKARAYDLLLQHYSTLLYPHIHTSESISLKIKEALKTSRKFK